MTRRGVMLGIVVLVGAALWFTWSRPPSSQQTDAVSVVTIGTRTFSSTVVAIGAVKPQIGAEVRVGSRISGRVFRLRANIGDRVAKGAVIAELETAELDAVVDQRRAELVLAQARLTAVDATAPAERAQAEATVASATAAARLASEDAARLRQLVQAEIVSTAEADAARDRAGVAAANLEAARKAASLVEVRSAEARRQATAAVAAAQAALDSANVGRSFTVLHAPISGVVGEVATLEGETVAAGLNAPTFVTIVDLDRLQVNAYVDEVDIGKIAVGQQARFTVDAFPARDYQGRVSAIYPTATIQDNVVKYVVALTIEEAEHGLRPEMTASVHIELESRDVLAAPTAAVRQEGGQSVVYVLGPDGLSQRTVRLGWREGAWVEVVEGLTVGDRVSTGRPPSEQERQ